jgi:hypothetical protein
MVMSISIIREHIYIHLHKIRAMNESQ